LVAGLALGGAAALVTTRALRGMLHGVAATDATTYAATAAAMLLLGLLASYLPARRAATTDPARVLREDA
jgi:ABC-type lipoprotein release transport system permease subunit